MYKPLFGGAFLVCGWRLTTILTTTVALQDFPNQRVRGVLRGKPALFEAVWFKVYSDDYYSPPRRSCSIHALVLSLYLKLACTYRMSIVEIFAWPGLFTKSSADRVSGVFANRPTVRKWVGWWQRL